MAKRRSRFKFGAVFGAMRRAGRNPNDPEPVPARLAIKPRKTAPMDPARQTMVLSEDIIARIFDFVHTTSPASLQNVALASSFFYHPARYAQHRGVTIDLDDAATAARFDYLAESGLLPAIRKLSVHSNGSSCAGYLSTLAELIAKMEGLRDLHWAGLAIPASILQGVTEARHIVKLHVTVLDLKGRDPQARQILTSIADTALLFSLRLKAVYFHAADCLEITQPLKRILLSCPNLRILSLDLDLPRDGRFVDGPPREYGGIGLSGGERPPPLEELNVYHYPWGYNSNGEYGFNCIGYPGETLETEYWVNTFDWSRLACLELTDHTNAASIILSDKLLPKLVSLTHVSLAKSPEFSPNPASQRQFLEQVPSMLESICVPTLRCVGVAAIARHSSTLRSLVIHQQELTDGSLSWNEDVMTGDDLVDLRERLPCLEDMAFDIGQENGEWPQSMLDTLASFPRLRCLTLWFGLGDRTAASSTRPHVTRAAAADVFHHLRENSPTKSLRRLHIYSALPPGPGSPLQHESGSKEISTSFICELAERDEEAARGVFSVFTPNLERETRSYN